ncbi:phosphopantetheine-binding protein [Cryptosporangium minutisporangium]|uniref:Carrier domain-containing protein n=1 Tax=Cryptosporangium minutisporangium TaxID=113569 RepID=A0ABP6T075_9ACTN
MTTTAGVPEGADATEAAVARIWIGLGLAPTSVQDDFFALGGQSLTLVRFLATVQEELGLELPIDALFETDLTIAAVARVVTAARLEAADADELALALAELDRMSEDELAALLAENE